MSPLFIESIIYEVLYLRKYFIKEEAPVKCRGFFKII